MNTREQITLRIPTHLNCMLQETSKKIGISKNALIITIINQAKVLKNIEKCKGGRPQK